MIEESTTIAETASPTEVSAPKKRRGASPKTVTSEAATDMQVADGGKPERAVKKRTEKSAGVKTAAGAKTVSSDKIKKVVKAPGRSRAKQAPDAAVLAPGFDDITALLKLEEENAQLRKALAEKLRAENADLRKRLGLA
ncbi:hypothetical protein N185_16110 [Sinorhizobium sp. GW3]|nr:hypothetical protein N185_16110 [Sinorhizobium sp. GW3]